MYCKNCGERVDGNASYCPNCGYPLNAEMGGTNDNYNNRQMGGNSTNECCTFCAAWCCMDMLCSACCN